MVKINRARVIGSGETEGLGWIRVTSTPRASNNVKAIGTSCDVLASSFKEGELLWDLGEKDSIVGNFNIDDKLLHALETWRRYVDTKGKN